MGSVLTNEKYGDRPVVLVNGYRYYVVSKHKTNFNARRQFKRRFKRPDFPRLAKIRKVGNWWMVLAVPKQFQKQGGK